MKRIVTLASVLVLLAAPVFAAGNKPQSVIIPENVQVGTSQVPAGTYKLTYTGTGSNVQVTLMQGKKTVITFAATAVEKKTANEGVNLITNGKVPDLKAIFLSDVTLTVQAAGATSGM